MKNATRNIDRITNNQTAFRTYAEFVRQCQTGYVPTIHGDNAEQKTLIRKLKRDGLKVWGNNGKNW